MIEEDESASPIAEPSNFPSTPQVPQAFEVRKDTEPLSLPSQQHYSNGSKSEAQVQTRTEQNDTPKLDKYKGEEQDTSQSLQSRKDKGKAKVVDGATLLPRTTNEEHQDDHVFDLKKPHTYHPNLDDDEYLKVIRQRDRHVLPDIDHDQPFPTYKDKGKAKADVNDGTDNRVIGKPPSAYHTAVDFSAACKVSSHV